MLTHSLDSWDISVLRNKFRGLQNDHTPSIFIVRNSYAWCPYVARGWITVDCWVVMCSWFNHYNGWLARHCVNLALQLTVALRFLLGIRMSHLSFSKEDTSWLDTTLFVSESRNLLKSMWSMTHVMEKAINWHFQQSRFRQPIQIYVHLNLQWFCAAELCVISHLSFCTTDFVFLFCVCVATEIKKIEISNVFLTVHHSIDLFHLPTLMHNSFIH